MIRQGIDIFKHTHADHCFDVPFLLWYKRRYGSSNLQLPTKIITDDVTKHTIETLIDICYFEDAKEAKIEWIDFKK